MDIQRQLKPVNRSIRNMVTRSVLQLSDVSQLIQTLQLTALKDEVLDNVEYFEPHGFTSRAQKGAEAIVFCPGGNRSSAICLVVADRRFRMKGLKEGEVALYTDEGDFIHFKRGNEIYINTENKLTVVAGNEVDVTAPLVNVTASTKVTFTTPDFWVVGDMTVFGDSLVTGASAVVGAMSSSTSLSDPLGTMQNVRVTYNGHTHDETNSVTNTPNQQMT